MALIKIAQFDNDVSADDLATTKQSSIYLPPGRHSVIILEVSDPAPNQYDASWVDISLTLADAAGRICMAYLSIPTKTLMYQTSKGPSPYRARELLSFCRSVWGDEEFPREVHVFLRKRFGDPSKLKHLATEVEVGYPLNKHYAKKVGGVIKLFKNDNQLDEGDFATFDAAEAHAKQKGLPYVKGPRVTNFVGVGKALKTKTSENDIPL